MKRMICFMLIIATSFMTACGGTKSSLVVEGLISEEDGTLEEPIFVDSDKKDDSNDNSNKNNQNNDAPTKTIGAVLAEDFDNIMLMDEAQSINDVMEAIRVNQEIVFMTEISSVKEGKLLGFGENSINGFIEGVILKPTIPTIPFVAYVFSLDDTQNAEEFARNLTACVDLKFIEVEEAEEIVVTIAGQYVFCVISKYYFES